jgi:trimeric autotransporter adhesin
MSTNEEVMLRKTRFCSLLAQLAVGFSVVLLALSVPAYTQKTASAVPDRITQAIDDSVLTTLKGNVHPLARAEFDRGPAPLSQPMKHMQLVLRRSPAQEADLDNFLKFASDERVS